MQWAPPGDEQTVRMRPKTVKILKVKFHFVYTGWLVGRTDL